MPRKTYDPKTKEAFISAARKARRAGKTWAQANKGNIVLLNPTDEVHQVLMLLGLTDVVKVELSKTAALEHF